MNLTISYDEPSDTLRIDSCTPYVEQGEDEIQPGVVARSNPESGRIENIEVLFFNARIKAGKPFKIPVDMDLARAS